MALSLKRSSSSLPFSSTPRPLKKCRRDNFLFALTKSSNYVSSSSSEEEDEYDEYAEEYQLAKRRKSTLTRRSSTMSAAETPLNIELSRAVSLYSDDEDDEDEENRRETGSTVSSPLSYNSKKDLNTRKSHSRKNSSSNILKDSAINNMINNSNVSSNDVRYLPESDRIARSRCFEYLVGAIDEAWARYCDAATYAEDCAADASAAADARRSAIGAVVSTDNESDASSGTACSSSSFAETEMTEYSESEVNSKKERLEQAEQQTSLQNLKDRLTNAKYYLQDFVDSDVYDDCVAFWRRWDMIKYCTIELVEDDEEEDIVESTIDELENGRCPSTV